MNYSPKKVKDLLNKHNFTFKKKFGQNFIIDENIIDSIITKSKIDIDTLVIEIGPGSGALTQKLADKSKKVICYEIDKTLKPILEDNLQSYNNINIIFDDFLKRNINNDIVNEKYEKLYIIANLPYYITTPIIIKLIEDNVKVDKIVVMVQKEVGDRFKAKPGSKEYNSLTIFLNYYFEIVKIMDVSRNVFIPKPNVDSIVVQLKSKKNKLEVHNQKLFFKLIRDSFNQRRKTIKNNLKEYNLNEVEIALKENGFTLNDRAEIIPIEVFVDIANRLNE